VFHRVRYTLRRRHWERRSAEIDAAYRARARRLGPMRWGHPGLAAVAAFRGGLPSASAPLDVARDALDGTFTFLGRRESLGQHVAWFRPDLDVGTRLWKTHLHEFSYAEDLARATRISGDSVYQERFAELARTWRAAAPIGCPGFALDAWNARAVATRLIHWAVAGSILELRGGESLADWLESEIAVHALFLRDNPELDLRGNHLIRDAVGLVFAQELVGGAPDALGWLERQVAEQVLPDGCHIERAPLYHAICLKDLIEVQLLLDTASPPWLSSAVARMAGLLEAISLGDGEIPLLGDSWLGELDIWALLEVVRRGGVLPEPAAPERHGGLVPLRAGDVRAVVRAGPHGPDYMLGHAHADLLSFDLSVGRARAITDTGTALYDTGPERQHLRSTAAHNTIRIDDAEQLEAWGSFRVGRRGRARVHAMGAESGWRWLSASCDAYRWRRGRPIHHRLIAVCAEGAIVLDAVLGKGRHRIESHMNEHPDKPGGVRIAALAAETQRRVTPLHEHFGETREMTQQWLEIETELPWCGGWLIACPGFEIAAEDAASTAALELAAGTVTCRIPGAAPLMLTWRPGSGDPHQALRFTLCPAEQGSAN
jgi:uncharacterized heparinase superfamily protein